ncbi:MAG: 5-(carboxyamino)imidazole ribonucleotide synthase [Robiginitomaculum sp.]|nr:5-(carboxyamino)imidazole ribonucleotide synthase [Robiginitomaculum sp.]
MPKLKPVGIFGGGQLAMMLAEAGTKLGLETHILSPNAACPAARSASLVVEADYEDLAAIRAFAEACSVISFEFENLPVRSLFHLAKAGHLVAPGPKVLELIQDRLTEKQFLQSCGIAIAPFARIDGAEDFAAAIADTGLPAVLKTRHFGYDGKGQTWITAPAQAKAAFDAIHHHPAVLESAVDFVRECSVIAARNAKGEFVHFPVTENLHKNGILRTSTVPANCSDTTAKQAITITRNIAEKLQYVGVLAVEFFELPGGELWVNEIAPRVHNSGHWTKGGATPDQFELHLRAITGMELSMPNCVPFAQMQNLIGDEEPRAEQLAGQGWQVVDYGKGQARPGRKMGHAVRVEGGVS